MEVIKFLSCLATFLIIASCSNTPEFETGEIKSIQLVLNSIKLKRKRNPILSARDLLSRKQIDDYAIPILYVELETGQNGTLTLYPGEGIGQTWLGADGATITFENGILKASRGMGDDVMGSTSSIPPWSRISKGSKYKRVLSYLDGDNQISAQRYDCEIKNIGSKKTLQIWSAPFLVTKYEENCSWETGAIKNVYFLDDNKVVRLSRQYHSSSLGYIITERLDK